MAYQKDLVEVVWLDAATTHGWESDAEVDSEDDPMITVGFLIRKTEDMLIIASSIDQETQAMSNGRIKIPLGMVQSYKVLRKSKGSAKKSTNMGTIIPEMGGIVFTPETPNE